MKSVTHETMCSKCGDLHSRKNQRYCLKCHAARMREWRKTHQDWKKPHARVRAIAGVYKRRGHLVPVPCKCGSENVEMHQADYTKPLQVEFVCRPCHLAIHAPQQGHADAHAHH